MKDKFNSYNLGFLIFLSLILIIVTGLLKSSFFGSIIVFSLFVIILLFIFLIWNLVYKLGVFAYEYKIKDIIKEFKKTKRKIQND